MKLILAAFVLLALFHTPVCLAEEPPGSINDIRKEIITLYDNYIGLLRALKGVETNVKEFSNTTLSLSLVKDESDIRLLFVEILNGEIPIESHTYSPLENDALNAGGRQLLHKGEIKQGNHNLKVLYSWVEGSKALPQKGSATIPISVTAGNNYFIELSMVKKNSTLNLNYSQLVFDNK